MKPQKASLTTLHERTVLPRAVIDWLHAGSPPERSPLEGEVRAALDFVGVHGEEVVLQPTGGADALDE